MPNLGSILHESVVKQLLQRLGKAYREGKSAREVGAALIEQYGSKAAEFVANELPYTPEELRQKAAALDKNHPLAMAAAVPWLSEIKTHLGA